MLSKSDGIRHLALFPTLGRNHSILSCSDVSHGFLVDALD